MNRDTVTELIRKPTLADLRERMRETVDGTNCSLIEHGRRVAGIALVIAAEWGFHPLNNAIFLDELRLAGEFHDIAEFPFVTETALNKMERHVEVGATLLREAGAPEAVVDAALYHHVSYAGGGYPDTMLCGEALPLSARIIAVADELATQTEDRSDRAGRPIHEVWTEILENRGVRFDPHVVDTLERSAFLKEAIDRNALPEPEGFLNFNRYPIGVAA